MIIQSYVNATQWGQATAKPPVKDHRGAYNDIVVTASEVWLFLYIKLKTVFYLSLV